MNWSFATNFLVALLAIVNPIGKVPLWVQASRGEDRPVRMRVALLIVGTGGAILLTFILFGEVVLAAFGIDLAAFRIGGGVVIFLIGVNMLNGKAVDIDVAADEDADTPLEKAKIRYRQIVIPMAVPIIAGPGSITTVVIYGSRAESPLEHAVLVGILVLVLSMVLGALLAGHRIRRVVGAMPLEVLTRLFGLILAAIAAQLILEGLAEVFPRLVEPG